MEIVSSLACGEKRELGRIAIGIAISCRGDEIVKCRLKWELSKLLSIVCNTASTYLGISLGSICEQYSVFYNDAIHRVGTRDKLVMSSRQSSLRESFT